MLMVILIALDLPGWGRNIWGRHRSQYRSVPKTRHRTQPWRNSKIGTGPMLISVINYIDKIRAPPFKRGKDYDRHYRKHNTRNHLQLSPIMISLSYRTPCNAFHVGPFWFVAGFTKSFGLISLPLFRHPPEALWTLKRKKMKWQSPSNQWLHDFLNNVWMALAWPDLFSTVGW